MSDVVINNNKQVASWLLICCALVFAMVVLGGVTRLTGSGLSMADWRPITGVLPPIGDSEWQRVFEMYQQTPEFQKKNAYMEVDDFKGIFWLGGYMGPDLTNVASKKGSAYARAFLMSGTRRMPNFNLNDAELDAMIAYLEFVDSTGRYPAEEYRIRWFGTVVQNDE